MFGNASDNANGEVLVGDGSGSLVSMKKIVRDQHRRELTSQIVGFVWLGDMLEYLSDTLSQVKAPHIPDVAGMSVKLADAVLDALEEREQEHV